MVCAAQTSCSTPGVDRLGYNRWITSPVPTQIPAPADAASVEGRHGASILLSHLARLVRAQSESALEPLGLRPRHLVALTVLRDNEGSTQQGLAGLLSIDRTNLVGLLNELETDGLIERRRDVDDRRRHLVAITGKGSRRLEEAEEALAEAEDRVLGALDPEQREQLYSLLQLASAGHAGDCSAEVAADQASACAAAAAEHSAAACAAAAADDLAAAGGSAPDC